MNPDQKPSASLLMPVSKHCTQFVVPPQRGSPLLCPIAEALDSAWTAASGLCPVLGRWRAWKPTRRDALHRLCPLLARQHGCSGGRRAREQNPTPRHGGAAAMTAVLPLRCVDPLCSVCLAACWPLRLRCRRSGCRTGAARPAGAEERLCPADMRGCCTRVCWADRRQHAGECKRVPAARGNAWCIA